MVYMGSKDRNSKRNAPKERYNNLIRQRYSLLKVKLFNKDIFEDSPRTLVTLVM